MTWCNDECNKQNKSHEETRKTWKAYEVSVSGRYNCLLKKTKNSKNILVCFSKLLFFLFELYRGEDHDENVEWLSYE